MTEPELWRYVCDSITPSLPPSFSRFDVLRSSIKDVEIKRKQEEVRRSATLDQQYEDNGITTSDFKDRPLLNSLDLPMPADPTMDSKLRNSRAR